MEHNPKKRPAVAGLEPLGGDIPPRRAGERKDVITQSGLGREKGDPGENLAGPRARASEDSAPGNLQQG